MSDHKMNDEPGQQKEYIDVLIVMDSTGSMQRWINSARDTVLEAFDEIQKKYPESHLRLGLICYRDIGDDERYVLHPFTETIEDVQTLLRKVVAKGGNDSAEDVAGALEHAIEWFRAPHPMCPSPSRTLLFVADAPAHGTRYHPITVGDRYPKGDPDGKEPFDQVQELAMMDVDMTVFRADSSMDMMIEEFGKAYQGTSGLFTVLDVTRQSSPVFTTPFPSPLFSATEMPPPISYNETFRTSTSMSVVQSVEKKRQQKKDSEFK